MTRLLEGRVALITGAGQGIGEATARRMSKEGASVVIFDMNGDAAERVAADVRRAGGRAHAIQGDVSQEADVIRAVDKTVSRFGGLHVLHNNAAMTSSNTDPAKDLTVLTTDVGYWDQMFAVNCRGTMLCCKHAIPHMQKAGKGSIINMSSVDAMTGDCARTAYAASKSAITSFTMSVATQFAQDGIRCNAVAPALTMSPVVAERFGGELKARMERHFLLPTAHPDQQASAIVFLASDESSYISGVVLRVDGGLLSHMPWYGDNRRDASAAL